MEISNDIIWIGASNNKQKIFESQYNIKNGMSYNSYVIKDEKNAILDTVDEGVTELWLKKLDETLNGEELDYLRV